MAVQLYAREKTKRSARNLPRVKSFLATYVTLCWLFAAADEAAVSKNHDASILKTSSTAIETTSARSPASLMTEKSIAEFDSELRKVNQLKVDRTKWKVALNDEAAFLSGLSDANFQKIRKAELLCEKGLLCLDALRLKHAETCLKQSLELQPSCSVSWAALGKIRSALSQKAEAERCLDKSLQLNPRNTLALSTQVRLKKLEHSDYMPTHTRYKELVRRNRDENYQLNDADRCIAVRDLLRNVENKDGFQFVSLGLAYKYLGDVDKARECFETGAKQTRGKELATYELAQWYAQKGDAEQAIGLTKKCESLNKEFLLPRLLRAHELQELKNWSGAKAECDKILQSREHGAQAGSSMRAEALSIRAYCNAQLDQRSAALADVRAMTSLKLDAKKQSEYLVRSASIRKLLGDKSGALADHEKAIKLSPRSYTGLKERGELMAAAGNYEQGAADIAESKQRELDAARSPRIETPSDAVLNDQVKHYTKLITGAPSSVPLLYERGYLRLALRQYKSAYEDFAQFAEDPGQPVYTAQKSAIMAALALRLTGDRTGASIYLRNYMQAHKNKNSANVQSEVPFILSETSAVDYIHAIPGKRAYAYLIIGLYRLAEPKQTVRDTASKYLDWAKLQLERGTNEQILSAVLSDRLFRTPQSTAKRG